MKQMIVAVIGTMVICIGGCAGSLSPHEELNQAVKKSFDATGFTYSSKSRVTNLSLPKQDADAASKAKGLKYLEPGLDIVRGLSVNMDGAVDMKGKRSEALYDLHYNKDNVEVSIKLPLLVDYNTQTLYVGTSFLTTILDVVSPQGPETRGKLIKIDMNELLKDGAARTPDLSKWIGDDRFNPENMAKNIDVFNNVFKDGILKAVAKLNDSCFADQPLTEQDRKTGVERRIQMNLGHDDSVTVVADMMDSMAQALFQGGVISKKEYDVLLTLTGKQVLDGFADKFTLTMTNDVGIAQSGHVGYLATRLSIADKEGNYQFGVENVSSFDNYNAPRFSITPETGRTVDFKEVLAAITAAKAKDKSASEPDEEAPDDDSCVPDGPAQDGAESM
ncbi:hypothetical protein [Geobacter sp. AOG2]|uniref:hypothetical protein n=1 Tax=Geobacter sp. AOG2 TaxID=1566347 RepID=UPI001CC554A9|nr:hypothetical protein [Geobacter sp. AOG2]GFE62049.1 hypothetical protein AOG2_26370 [Geobacter sp. AOG2]